MEHSKEFQDFVRQFEQYEAETPNATEKEAAVFLRDALRQLPKERDYIFNQYYKKTRDSHEYSTARVRSALGIEIDDEELKTLLNDIDVLEVKWYRRILCSKNLNVSWIKFILANRNLTGGDVTLRTYLGHLENSERNIEGMKHIFRAIMTLDHANHDAWSMDWSAGSLLNIIRCHPSSNSDAHSMAMYHPEVITELVESATEYMVNVPLTALPFELRHAHGLKNVIMAYIDVVKDDVPTVPKLRNAVSEFGRCIQEKQKLLFQSEQLRVNGWINTVTGQSQDTNGMRPNENGYGIAR